MDELIAAFQGQDGEKRALLLVLREFSRRIGQLEEKQAPDNLRARVEALCVFPLSKHAMTFR